MLFHSIVQRFVRSNAFASGKPHPLKNKKIVSGASEKRKAADIRQAQAVMFT
jgi:hypothetical protein